MSEHTDKKQPARGVYEPLSEADIRAMQVALLSQHELYPLTPGRINRLCAMAVNSGLYAEEIQRLRDCTPQSAELPSEPTPEMIAAVSTILQPYAAKLVWKRMLETAPRSATLSINELAERCWPAVRSWLNKAEQLAMHPPKPQYKTILEADADRARKLLDDIEALVGRPVEPHRSGGPTS